MWQETLSQMGYLGTAHVIPERVVANKRHEKGADRMHSQEVIYKLG